MSKTFIGIAATILLLGACNKSIDKPAQEEARGPALHVGETTPAPATISAPAVADVSHNVGLSAAADKTIDDTIDSVLGDHTRYRAVFDAYQKAVAAGDKEAVAALVDYPFTANIDGKRTVIGDSSELVKRYDQIVTPAIAAVVRSQKYSELMVNGKGVMFGSGETWLNGVCKKGSADCSEFEVRVVAIQPGG